ncbi:MAG: hypothetical protein HQL50_03885 [Magnetococcales bacterium]|nr:hypothetical protein [Magnetococcales bacterium]
MGQDPTVTADDTPDDTPDTLGETTAITPIHVRPGKVWLLNGTLQPGEERDVWQRSNTSENRLICKTFGTHDVMELIDEGAVPGNDKPLSLFDAIGNRQRSNALTLYRMVLDAEPPAQQSGDYAPDALEPWLDTQRDREGRPHPLLAVVFLNLNKTIFSISDTLGERSVCGLAVTALFKQLNSAALNLEAFEDDLQKKREEIEKSATPWRAFENCIPVPNLGTLHTDATAREPESVRLYGGIGHSELVLLVSASSVRALHAFLDPLHLIRVTDAFPRSRFAEAPDDLPLFSDINGYTSVPYRSLDYDHEWTRLLLEVPKEDENGHTTLQDASSDEGTGLIGYYKEKSGSSSEKKSGSSSEKVTVRHLRETEAGTLDGKIIRQLQINERCAEKRVTDVTLTPFEPDDSSKDGVCYQLSDGRVLTHCKRYWEIPWPFSLKPDLLGACFIRPSIDTALTTSREKQFLDAYFPFDTYERIPTLSESRWVIRPVSGHLTDEQKTLRAQLRDLLEALGDQVSPEIKETLSKSLDALDTLAKTDYPLARHVVEALFNARAGWPALPGGGSLETVTQLFLEHLHTPCGPRIGSPFDAPFQPWQSLPEPAADADAGTAADQPVSPDLRGLHRHLTHLWQGLKANASEQKHLIRDITPFLEYVEGLWQLHLVQLQLNEDGGGDDPPLKNPRELLQHLQETHFDHSCLNAFNQHDLKSARAYLGTIDDKGLPEREEILKGCLTTALEAIHQRTHTFFHSDVVRSAEIFSRHADGMLVPLQAIHRLMHFPLALWCRIHRLPPPVENGFRGDRAINWTGSVLFNRHAQPSMRHNSVIDLPAEVADDVQLLPTTGHELSHILCNRTLIEPFYPDNATDRLCQVLDKARISSETDRASKSLTKAHVVETFMEHLVFWFDFEHFHARDVNTFLRYCWFSWRNAGKVKTLDTDINGYFYFLELTLPFYLLGLFGDNPDIVARAEQDQNSADDLENKARSEKTPAAIKAAETAAETAEQSANLALQNDLVPVWQKVAKHEKYDEWVKWYADRFMELIATFAPDDPWFRKRTKITEDTEIRLQQSVHTFVKVLEYARKNQSDDQFRQALHTPTCTPDDQTPPNAANTIARHEQCVQNVMQGRILDHPVDNPYLLARDVMTRSTHATLTPHYPEVYQTSLPFGSQPQAMRTNLLEGAFAAIPDHVHTALFFTLKHQPSLSTTIQEPLPHETAGP